MRFSIMRIRIVTIKQSKCSKSIKIICALVAIVLFFFQTHTTPRIHIHISTHTMPFCSMTIQKMGRFALLYYKWSIQSSPQKIQSKLLLLHLICSFCHVVLVNLLLSTNAIYKHSIVVIYKLLDLICSAVGFLIRWGTLCQSWNSKWCI